MMEQAINAMRGALDALQYVDRTYPNLSGWGTRAAHMTVLRAAIAAAEQAQGVPRVRGQQEPSVPASALHAGSIDTPEFRDLIRLIFGDAVEVAYRAIITHIDRHTSEAVQAARKEAAGGLTVAWFHQVSSFGPWIECNPSAPGAVRAILATKKEQANG